MKMAVRVSKSVLDGITAVRDSGITNMLDREMVIRLCSELGFSIAARWVDRHKKEYSAGVFFGFEEAETEITPQEGEEE